MIGPHDDKFTGVDRELLMVVFIVCLSAVILSLITIGHYVIERPRKRKVMLNALRTYLQKKNPNGSPETTGLMNSSSQAIFKDTNKANNSQGPTITVTDFSSSHTLNNSNNDEPRETDTLLQNNSRQDHSSIHFSASGGGGGGGTGSNSSDHHSLSAAAAMAANSQHKVTFVIGETIIEEPYDDPASGVTFSLDPDDNNNSNPNEESLKSVSHLLDDKPWLNNSNTNSNSNQRIISRNNSISSQNN